MKVRSIVQRLIWKALAGTFPVLFLASTAVAQSWSSPYYINSPSPSDAIPQPIVDPAPVASEDDTDDDEPENLVEGEKAEEAEEESATSALEEMQEELDERLKALEEDFEKQVEAEKQAKSDAKKKPTFKLGGRVHMDYWNFMDNDAGTGWFENPTTGDDPEDRLLFRRLRMEFSGDIPQNMLWRMQLDFNNPGTPEYKDAYFGWNNLPGNHTFLIGNQKRPLGLDHLNSSRYNVFAERPLVVEAFNEDARRIGACLYGHTDDEVYNWRMGMFNLENTSTDGRYIGDSMQLGGYGRLAATPWYDDASGGRGYFHWALAGAVAHPDGDVFANDTNANEGRFRTRPQARSNERWLNTGRIAGADWYEILAMESVLNLGSWQFTGEYMANFMQRDNVTAGTGPDLFFHGFYVYASYFLTGEHMPFERTSGTLARVKPFENFFLVDRCCGGSGSGWGAWQVALRYDYLDLTDEDIAGGVGQNVTMGLNWHWNAYSKIQTNVIYGNIADHVPVNGFDSANFWILGMRYMCDF